MKKKENLVAVLERMGYNPKYDDDGDVLILYQMKHVYFLLNEEEEDYYFSLMSPQFINLNVLQSGIEFVHDFIKLQFIGI